VLAGAAAFLVGAAAGDSINAAGALALLALGFLIRWTWRIWVRGLHIRPAQ
jgi:hypothetical protein